MSSTEPDQDITPMGLVSEWRGLGKQDDEVSPFGNGYRAALRKCAEEMEDALRRLAPAPGGEPPASSKPAGVYCRVQIKGYQEYTGYLTEGTFCGQPYGFLRDAGGREIAKFPPDSVHLITPPEPEMPGPWERPALPAAGDDDEGDPF